ncbi:MAG: alpha/beta fold hydrolase [Nannocystales bacterium]
MKRLAAAAAGMLLGGCLHFHDGPLPNEPADARFADVQDARVRFVDEGQGPAVVLIHGFASSLENWDPVLEDLLEGHRVLALDLKGFGWTDRPEGDYSPSAQAALVFALMDQRGIERAAVVGHSWGSSVVLAMALDQPERVERIALYDAWVFEEQLPPMFVWARAKGLGELLFRLFYLERPDDKVELAYHDRSVVSQDHVEAIEQAQARPGTTAAALAAVRGQRYAEVQRHYHEIEQPVLLLWGREDRITLLEDGERLAGTLPNAELRVYPNCGHFPMREAEPASTRALVDFLAPARTKMPEPEVTAEPESTPPQAELQPAEVAGVVP